MPEAGRNAAQERQRILLVVHGMNVGGIERYVLSLLEHHDRAMLQLDVCTKGPEAGVLAPEVHRLDAGLLSCRYTHLFMPYVWRMSRLLREGGYDAVCDFTGDFACGSMLAARLARVPTRIAAYRSSGVKYRVDRGRRLAASALRLGVRLHATKVVANSQSNLSAFFPRRSGSGYQVIHNGVDLARFSWERRQSLRAEAREELGYADDEVVIGHVGSFNRAKGHDLLLEAFHQLRAERRRARLLLVGDGELRGDVEETIAAMGLQGQVACVGIQADVTRCLAAMDLFVLPSRFEGFPNALLEAQAMGLPVVATDRPEMREAMPPVNHDCLFPAEDPAALARTLQWLIDDEAAAAARGAAGAAHVRQRFDIVRAVEEFFALFT